MDGYVGVSEYLYICICRVYVRMLSAWDMCVDVR